MQVRVRLALAGSFIVLAILCGLLVEGVLRRPGSRSSGAGDGAGTLSSRGGPVPWAGAVDRAAPLPVAIPKEAQPWDATRANTPPPPPHQIPAWVVKPPPPDPQAPAPPKPVPPPDPLTVPPPGHSPL